MEAFRCDRCGEYGPAAGKETLAGTVVRAAIELYHDGGHIRNTEPNNGFRHADDVDLCAGCADLLSLALKEWWKPGETMVTFESIEELAESFDE